MTRTKVSILTSLMHGMDRTRRDWRLGSTSSRNGLCGVIGRFVTSWMFVEKLCNIINFPVVQHVAVLLGGVLLQLIQIDCASCSDRGGWLHDADLMQEILLTQIWRCAQRKTRRRLKCVRSLLLMWLQLSYCGQFQRTSELFSVLRPSTFPEKDLNP